MKEVVEQLGVLSDLLKESTDSLKEKYLRSEEVYSDFLRKFTQFFATRRMLQLRISRQYSKILNLVEEGNKKYDSKENQDNFGVLSSEILQSLTYKVDDEDYRDAEESIALFKQNIGLNSTDRLITYVDSVDTIAKSGEKYLELRNSGAIKNFTKNVYREIRRANSLQNAKELVQNGLNDETRKALELCNNEDFLLFANYLINFSNNVDGNFIEDVQNIINLSRILQTIGLANEGLNEENYNRLVEFTNKTLKKYAKEKEKKEKTVLRKAKKLSQ